MIDNKLSDVYHHIVCFISHYLLLCFIKYFLMILKDGLYRIRRVRIFADAIPPVMLCPTVDMAASSSFRVTMYDSRPMLGVGSSSGVELFQVFMGTRLWQDGGRPAGVSWSVHPHIRTLSVHLC